MFIHFLFFLRISCCYLQHLVRTRLNASWHVAGVKGHLLHLCKIVGWVPVENYFAHRNQRVVFMRPNLNGNTRINSNFKMSQTAS